MRTSAEPLIQQLRAGFPTTIGDEVGLVARTMTSNVSYGVLFRESPHFVNVGGERLRLPHRHGFTPRSWRSEPGLDATIEAAIAVGNYDGFVRQRSVGPLVRSGASWTTPYILELASDYVVEIISELEEHLEAADLDDLRRYIADNPAHWALTTHRVESYWNEYYRTTTRAEATSSYPGFRVLSAIAGDDPALMPRRRQLRQR